jgi:virginiamycin A acetyltransferase
MSLQDKRDLFLRGALSADRHIPPADLAILGAGPATYLKSMKFETGARVGSPLLPNTAQGFFGAFSYMNGEGYLRDRVFVGRFSSIGRRITIGAGNHFTTGLSTSPMLSGGHALDRYSPEELKQLGLENTPRKSALSEIGCDVWIGDGAVILPGLRIDHGAVIGANAVVTKDVPPYAIVGGTPARILKYRFPQEQIEALLVSQWWEYPVETIKTLPLGNVIGCLDRLRDLGPPPPDAYETYECAEQAV